MSFDCCKSSLMRYSFQRSRAGPAVDTMGIETSSSSRTEVDSCSQAKNAMYDVYGVRIVEFVTQVLRVLDQSGSAQQACSRQQRVSTEQASNQCRLAKSSCIWITKGL